jgi:hypothetical protein
MAVRSDPGVSVIDRLAIVPTGALGEDGAAPVVDVDVGNVRVIEQRGERTEPLCR